MQLLKKLDYEIVALTRDRETIAARTRRVYDVLSTIYPLSTYCFHSRAHKRVLESAGIRDGMSVLEVATGSGEMFRRLVRANPGGKTVGLDLSPRMAARTLKQVRRDFPSAWTECQAGDARYLPFQNSTFDSIVCCYMLELFSTDDILLTLSEFHRVLKHRGTFTMVLIGQNGPVFNRLYKVATRMAPAFWGQQVELRMPELLEGCDFRIIGERHVVQSGYPSRVVTVMK
ncbi:MAG: methyltransferase domain-containing protein [Acidobacteriia bacterium]|nr:methyltransferase domain-containing protein [Terriglobia bacterium]